MKRRDRKSQREEKSRKEKIREEEESEERRFRYGKRYESCEIPVFFAWFVAREGQKVGSLQRRVRSQLARWEMKNCTPLWRETHFEVKMLKTPHVRATFGSWDVEKVHTVVAQSTFPSQNFKNTTCLRHFWKLRCRKSVRRCSAKHISKSKCTNYLMYTPLLEVRMSFCVAGARDCGPCQKSAKDKGFVAFRTCEEDL